MPSSQSTYDFSRYGMLLAIPGGILYIHQISRITVSGALSRPYPFGRIQKDKPLRAPLRHAKDQNTKSEGLCTALTYIEVIYSMPAKRPGHDRNT